jgi:hypothetical protein
MHLFLYKVFLYFTFGYNLSNNKVKYLKFNSMIFRHILSVSCFGQAHYT